MSKYIVLKKYSHICFPLAVFLFLPLCFLSQPTDTELASLLNGKGTEKQISILDSLSVKYRSVQVQKAISYALKACELAEGTGNKELLGRKLITLGKAYR